MKRIFLCVAALLFVCAIAIFVITTHAYEPRATAPAFYRQRTFSQFAP